MNSDRKADRDLSGAIRGRGRRVIDHSHCEECGRRLNDDGYCWDCDWEDDDRTEN